MQIRANTIDEFRHAFADQLHMLQAGYMAAARQSNQKGWELRGALVLQIRTLLLQAEVLPKEPAQ